MKKQQGFTLIELLVVIAIIGILAAVVLASLNSARDKSKIAAIKANLKNFQSQAELYYSDNSTYEGLCNPDNSVIHASIQPFINTLKGIAGTTNVKCFVYTSEITPYFYYTDEATQTRNFAAVVAFKNVHYAVDNIGVVTFSASDASGGATLAWSAAQGACATVGKRLPSVEQMKALWNIYNISTPAGFSSFYWSGSPSLSVPTEAYGIDFTVGGIGRGVLTMTASVRCVS